MHVSEHLQHARVTHKTQSGCTQETPAVPAHGPAARHCPPPSPGSPATTSSSRAHWLATATCTHARFELLAIFWKMRDYIMLVYEWPTAGHHRGGCARHPYDRPGTTAAAAPGTRMICDTTIYNTSFFIFRQTWPNLALSGCVRSHLSRLTWLACLDISKNLCTKKSSV